MLPACDAAGCGEPGRHECSRCGERFYCSKPCQERDWQTHMLTCDPNSGKGNEPAPDRWDPPVPHPRRHIFTAAAMAAGPDQPMDPPPMYDYLNDWWQDRTFHAPDGSSFTASFLPPLIKEQIRAGLRDKSLTWDYLAADNFLFLIVQATFPLDRLSDLVQTMRAESPKPDAAVLCEATIEHYWRTHTTIGYDEFDRGMYDALRRNGLRTPLTYAGHFCDELREFTHIGGGSNAYPIQPCLCYHCQKRPHAEAVEEQLWEALRAKASDRGKFIMSYKAYLDQSRSDPDQHLSAAAMAQVGPSQLGAWSYPEDEQTKMSRVSRQNAKQVVAILDAAHREERLPTHSEIDRVVGLVGVSRKAFEQEEDDFAMAAFEKAEARVLALAAGGGGGGGGSGGGGGGSGRKRSALMEAAAAALAAGGESPGPGRGRSASRGRGSSSGGGGGAGSRSRSGSGSRGRSRGHMDQVQGDDDDEDEDEDGGGVGVALSKPSRRCAGKVLSYADHNERGELSEDEEEAWGSSDEEEDEDEDGDGYGSGSGSGSGSGMEPGSDEEEGGKPKKAAKRRKAAAGAGGGAAGGGSRKKAGGGNSGGLGSGAGKWTEELGEALREAATHFGGLPEKGAVRCGFWEDVAGRVNEQTGAEFTNQQCQQKWKNLSAGESLPWSEEQAAELAVIVRRDWDREAKKQRAGFWEDVGKELHPPRTGLHCNAKWKHLGRPLDGDINSGPFSAEEDAAILAGKARGDSWAKIAKAINRSQDGVRNRYTKLSSKGKGE